LDVPLPELFSRRYAAIPPVRAVRAQTADWGSVGASRTVVLADGGSFLETLTEVDAPSKFGYHISDLKGLLQPLVLSVDGRFTFVPVGTGVRATWAWTVEPRGRAGELAMPAFARMWRGYARQALEQLEHILVAPSPRR
jgi:hypothetical protein